MARFKKIFAATTIFVTVLSMSVFVAPESKAASAGDLIKMDGLSSVYYLGSDGKRYVFPNEATYFSWYSDFSSVVTISQSELEALPLGANVTIRPGTKLVKITTNPKVYAVTPGGNLVAVPDETTAKALYGDNWNKMIVDVPDGFFSNYKISADVLTSAAYPTGSLVKFGTSPDVYYIDNGTARKIASEAAFLANRFKWDDVITSTLAVPTTGSEITGAESALTDTASGAGGVIGGGTGLVVALSSDTLSSTNVPSRSTLVPFTTVNLTASNDGPVTVSEITFTRFGTGATTDFSGGYLYAGDTRLTNIRSVNSSDNKITLSNLNLTIPAGATKSVTLRMNAKIVVPPATNPTGSHSFRIAQASDVKTAGATVSGSFPVAGNMMTYADVNAATITLTAGAGIQNKNIGETNVSLGEYTINNDNFEDVTISRIRLKQEGDAGNAAINNLSLDLDGTIVKTGVSMADKFVDFVLDTPYKLLKSRTITATVRGDIVTDINKTVKLTLNNVVDFDAKGSAYGNFYSASVSNSWGTTNVDTTTIKGSKINISFDGPQATDIKKDSTDNVFAYLMIKTDNEDVNLERLPVTIDMSSASSLAALANVEMVDVNGNGSYSVSSEPTGTDPETVFFENVLIKKGVQYKFAIRGDVPNANITIGHTYKVSINTATVNDLVPGLLKGSYVANDVAVLGGDFSASSLTGQLFTIAQPTVTFSKIALNDATVVKSAQKVTLYRGKITASAVDNLKVSRIKATSTLNVLTTLADAFDRISLYKTDADGNEVALLDDETSLSGSTITFSGFNLDVPKGISGTQYFAIKGNVSGAPTVGSTTLALSGTAADHLVRDADSNTLAAGQYTINVTAGPLITVGGTGSFTAVVDTNEAGINTAKNILGGTRALIGRIKFTATNEAALVKDLLVANVGTANDLDVGNVYLYKEKEMTTLYGGTSLGSTGAAFFENLNAGSGIEIPTTGVTYVYIAADVKGIDYSSSPAGASTARALQTIALQPVATAGGFSTKVTGKSTGDSLTNNIAAGATATSTVMGAVMSAIDTDFANGTLSNTTGRTVFSFKVTAPTSSNADYDGTALGLKLATTTFTFSGMTGAGAQVVYTNFRLKRTDANGLNEEHAAKITGGGAATLAASTTLAVNFIDTFGAATDLDVKPGQTAVFELVAAIEVPSTGSFSVETSLENVNSNLTYTHNFATVGGTLAGQVTPVNPLLTGVSSVRKGVLSVTR